MMNMLKVAIAISVAFILAGCPKATEIHLKNESDSRIFMEQHGRDVLIPPQHVVVVPEGRAGGLPLDEDGIEALRIREIEGAAYCYRVALSHVPSDYFTNGGVRKVRFSYRGGGRMYVEPYDEKSKKRAEKPLLIQQCRLH